MCKTIVMLAATAIAAAAVAPSSTAASQPPPLPSPGSFAGRIDNPWFPLEPGTVYVYRGSSDGEPARDVLTVTRRTKKIQRVRATVIDDRVYQHGRLVERTTDWYAQDKAGNVWYLGEQTATLGPSGEVRSTEGSWQAGVDGARAGIYMPAHPRVGQTGEQEFYRGHAEDRFKVLSLFARVHTPAGSSRHALLTRETTPLESGVVDHKLYVRGIGTVREETIRGGRERFVLVSVDRRPRSLKTLVRRAGGSAGQRPGRALCAGRPGAGTADGRSGDRPRLGRPWRSGFVRDLRCCSIVPSGSVSSSTRKQ